MGGSMASTLLDRLAAVTEQDIVNPSPGRKAEIAAIRAVFDGYFARLDAALEAHERRAIDRARDDLGAAIAGYAEEAQATADTIEQLLWRRHGQRG